MGDANEISFQQQLLLHFNNIEPCAACLIRATAEIYAFCNMTLGSYACGI